MQEFRPTRAGAGKEFLVGWSREKHAKGVSQKRILAHSIFQEGVLESKKRTPGPVESERQGWEGQDSDPEVK